LFDVKIIFRTLFSVTRGEGIKEGVE